ncbi:MAG: TIGR04282 family arsenosugar biosynthesis glycosyltransferase [Saprospiraceae bacterium]|nr:TIGR04282 family arsenosugar biosynthesis glycosyltransferase [Saprospiraceae bacterium]
MCTLLLFIRNPELGKVKTRLARSLGDEAALRIYRLLLVRAREAALQTDAARWLFYSESIRYDDDWPMDAFHKTVQTSGDLGEKMAAAFQQAFAAGATKAVIMGSDCPELTGELLNQAFELLNQSDFVIGPAHDGGYYLLGMNQFEPAVFQHIVWSTETVCVDTESIIFSLGKSVRRLPTLSDIDEAEDWEGFLSRNPGIKENT